MAPVISPFLLNEKLPIRPLVTCVSNTFLITAARLPSDFSIASSSTCAACAARIAYGWTFVMLYAFLKPSMNVSAAPL